MSAKKILIVDDSKVVLRALSMLLQNSGYFVITAEGGSDAVSSVRHERPDLILLDVNLPPEVGFDGGVAWDGFLIMDWLKRMDSEQSIPVIIITAGDPYQYQDRAAAAGVMGIFQKPIDNHQLLLAIQETLGDVPVGQQS
jgi:two-component system sensor histidine kinase ChiS